MAIDLGSMGDMHPLLVRALARTVYRRLTLFTSELVDHGPGAPCAASPPLELLADESIPEYVTMRPDFERDEADRRLAAGGWCVLTRLDGRVVSGVWVAQGRAEIEYLRCQLALLPDEVYLYDSFTAPDVRGRGAAWAPRAGGLRRPLVEMGFRRVLALVLSENRPAVRVMEKAGWVRRGGVATVSVGPWRRTLYRGDAGRRGPA